MIVGTCRPVHCLPSDASCVIICTQHWGLHGPSAFYEPGSPAHGFNHILLPIILLQALAVVSGSVNGD